MTMDENERMAMDGDGERGMTEGFD